MCLDQVGVLEHQVTAAQNGLKLFEAKGDTSCAGKPAWGLGKPISDNYWSFDACRLIPTDGAELELMFRSQIESAWISALDPKIVTRDATVDAVLVDWRKKIADASGKCGPGSCDTRPISSVQDYAANNSIDRYESLCSHLKDYQAIRQGRCPDQWKDGHCANGFPTVAAEVSLNASTDATKFAISGKALLRSPESIIYYLGQVVRAQDLSRAGHGEALHDSDDGFARYWDNNGTSPQEYALMSLKPVEKNVDDNASAVLAVEHGDTTYAVVPEKVACVVATPETAADPNSGCDRSMGVVNAVLMLIGLQRSATELPTTPTVNVVGGG
jgi:hypothetical protein